MAKIPPASGARAAASTPTTPASRTPNTPASTTAKSKTKQPVVPEPSVVKSASKSKSKAAEKPAEKIAAPSKAALGAISNYSSAVRYLLERTDFERMRTVKYNEETFTLARMHAILEKLGNPHRQIRTVHVAGTNGKGSTVAMIASMLQACGYAVGVYTSPHLIDIRERIAVNGALVEKAAFAELTKQVATAAVKAGVDPTFFEVLTAAAFLHFVDEAVDIAIIEVGLGGRLDSTNVITPDACVITSIDFDHTKLLGNTLPEIAREKAGIFKRGVPAFIF